MLLHLTTPFLQIEFFFAIISFSCVSHAFSLSSPTDPLLKVPSNKRCIPHTQSCKPQGFYTRTRPFADSLTQLNAEPESGDNIRPLPDHLKVFIEGGGLPEVHDPTIKRALQKTADLLHSMSDLHKDLKNIEVVGECGGAVRPETNAKKEQNASCLTSGSDNAIAKVTFTGLGKPVKVELNHDCMMLSRKTLEEYISRAMVDAWEKVGRLQREKHASNDLAGLRKDT